MTVDAIEGALIAALDELQECGGSPPLPLSGDTCPIGDLAGFDSLNAVETALLLAGTLGRKVSYNLFLPRHRDQGLSVREIAQAIHRAFAAEEGADTRP